MKRSATFGVYSGQIALLCVFQQRFQNVVLRPKLHNQYRCNGFSSCVVCTYVAHARSQHQRRDAPLVSCVLALDRVKEPGKDRE